jgi:hypothetical protein
VRLLERSPFGSGDLVEYTAINGSRLRLRRFEGVHVAILVPPSALGGALPIPLARVLLDRYDLFYERYLELVGREPYGEGLLPVAWVPSPCNGVPACGYVGAKGIEIDDDMFGFYGEETRLFLVHDFAPGPIGHEMAHNFDVFHEYLSYLPEHFHAWTQIYEYVHRYGRMGDLRSAPDQIFEPWFAGAWSRYRDSQDANWKKCVQNLACEGQGIEANATWAGFGAAIAELHGPGRSRTRCDISAHTRTPTLRQPRPRRRRICTSLRSPPVLTPI